MSVCIMLIYEAIRILQFLACFMNKDCFGLLVLVGYFAAAVKYRVVLGDGTVVVETLEGGVEFHMKDGNNVELCCFLDEI